MAKGKFITFEGGEGAGKSTQVRALAEHLKRRGLEVVLTREPGGSTGAEQIRKLLVDGEPGRWDGMTEALLNFAARRDHLVKTVWPALAAGKWVISDRFADSTMAYQGYGHAMDVNLIKTLWQVSIDGFRPDLTVILDLDVKVGLDRALARAGGEDRYERMDVSFHQRLRDGFLTIANDEPDRCAVISALGSIEEIEQRIASCVDQRLFEHS